MTHGAYVAKPEDAVDPPDVPDGWDGDWDFPGPNPPGYEPDYLLVLTAPESTPPGGAVSVIGSLRDHDTYATIEPEPSEITWGATVDGEVVNIRFSGDEDYASSISSNCVFGTYWEATPDIEFELTVDNFGDTLTLTGASVIRGEDITETVDIDIIPPRYSVSIVSQLTSWNIIDEEGSWVTATVVAEIAIESFSGLSDRGTVGQTGVPPGAAFTSEVDGNLSEVDITANNPIVTASSAELNADTLYYIISQVNSYNANVTIISILTITNLDTEEVVVSKTKVWNTSGISALAIYATIDEIGTITSTLFD